MKHQKLLKLLEFLPVLGFALVYWRYSLLEATFALMLLMTLFVVVVKVLGEKLTPLQLASWVIIMVLGAASLSSKSEEFIKWKTTLINGLIASTLFISHIWGTRKTLVERALAGKLVCDVKKLQRVNCCLGFYFLLLGCLNLYIAYNFPTDIWMKFRLFGISGLNIGVVVVCFVYLREEIKRYLDTQ